jgi:ABC-type lipoprotein release transport system permease subunit
VLYGVGAVDPLVIGTVPVIVLLVVLAATLGPALKAARTDPGTTLRSE